MSKYCPLQTKVWRDKDFKKSKKDAKLLFLYLISNESVNNSGIYEIPISTISEETSINCSTVKQLLGNGSIKNIHYDIENEIVFVVKRRKHAPGGNPVQVQKGIISEFKQNSKTFLWNEFIKLNPQFKEIFSTVGQPLVNGSLPLPLPLPIDSKDLTNNKPLKIEKEDLETAEFIFAQKRKVHPECNEPNMQEWGNAVRLMRERDKRACELIREVYAWAMQDEFWSSVCLSPLNLRKNWEQIVAQKSRGSPGKPGGKRILSPMDQAMASRGEFVDKVTDRANQIQKENPDWIKQAVAFQVIKETKKEDMKPANLVLYNFMWIENPPPGVQIEPP